MQGLEPLVAEMRGLFPLSTQNLHLQTRVKAVDERQASSEESMENDAHGPDILLE
jgi:hypothetical protein